MYAKITGTGSCLPEYILSNDELSKRVETSDEWIQKRVGIAERRIASAEEDNTFLAATAAQKALDAAGLSPEDIDLILVATATGDYVMPSTAVRVQHALKMEKTAMAFDISAACSGFIYGLDIAKSYIENKVHQHILVIGCERMSRLMNWEDRSTCVLFGDGAGAVVLSASSAPGIIGSCCHASGKYTDLLCVKNNLPKEAFSKQALQTSLNMEGNKVFRYAVEMLGAVVEEILEQHQLTKSDIDWLIPHQANERIIAATAKRLGVGMDQVILTLKTHGNTSSASVPLALDVAMRDGRIKPGQKAILEAFGSGFVWGAILVQF